MEKQENKKIEQLLSRGVEEVIEKDALEKKLKIGKKIRVKFGIDPTSPNIHLGRAIPLLKLRDFQELGHKIILIIGDFTGVIGDTSDKESERPMLTEKQVKENMKTYIQQAEKILDIKKCEICYNSKWLGKLNYREIANQANIFSLNEFCSRENIKKRLDAGKRVSLRELLYPLAQGYDSVVARADIEIGGTDQRFNLLTGREMQRYYKQKPQDIMTNPLIEGLDNRKMSSSWGNTINLFDSANEMFGKIMSLKDELIIKYFILTTRIDLAQIEKYKKEIKAGANPKDYKMKLGFEIARFYHSEKDAEKAQNYFIEVFAKKQVPDKMLEIKPSAYDILTILKESGVCLTKSDARRVVEQKGVRINKIVVDDFKTIAKKRDIIQKGKRFFIKVK
ncbi:MAG: tyrosine--tRNA ligase [Patescibacteria group bacterium]|nr:tyrosine--tRNA ligase [Patescibacteria group bacterium]